MSGLGRSLHVLLDEGVNALAAIPAIANLDGVTMIAKMNACLLSGKVAMDIEDCGRLRLRYPHQIIID